MLEHLQALTTGELVVHDFFATVVGDDRHLVELLAHFDVHATRDVRDRSGVAGHAGLEQLLHARKTTGDVLTDAALLLERTHGQLRAGLTDGLRGDDADGLTDVDQLAGGHRAAVARGADAGARGAGQHGAYLHLGDACGEQCVDRRVAQVVATFDDHVAAGVDCVHCQRPRVRRGLDVRIADQRTIGLFRGNRGHDAALSLAIVLAHDDVLRHVDQTTGQVTRVRRTKGGVGQTLSGAVRVDEVLQHGQTFTERRLDGARDELTLRVRHQALHACQGSRLVETYPWRRSRSAE